ncbi:HTH-type transcriptional regulator PrtR [compost metagenome]
MNTSGDRLKALLQDCGLTTSDFAALRSVTPQHVNNWFRRGVPLARVDEMADLFCVHRRWLRDGEGPKHPNPIRRPCLADQLYQKHPSTLSGHDSHLQQLPLHELRDGQLTPVANNHLRLPAQALQALGITAQNAICLAMPAANMAPLIALDAILAIDLGLTQVIDGEPYALLHNGSLRVHNLSLDQDGTLSLHSYDSRNHPVERYSADQCQAQGLEVLGGVFHWSHFRQHRPV